MPAACPRGRTAGRDGEDFVERSVASDRDDTLERLCPLRDHVASVATPLRLEQLDVAVARQGRAKGSPPGRGRSPDPTWDSRRGDRRPRDRPTQVDEQEAAHGECDEHDEEEGPSHFLRRGEDDLPETPSGRVSGPTGLLARSPIGRFAGARLPESAVDGSGPGPESQTASTRRKSPKAT